MDVKARLSSLSDWAILAGVLAALLGAIWLLGGFRPATASVRPIAAGEQIDLRHWEIAVQSAQYTDQARAGYDVEPRIRIAMRVVNLDDATQLAPNAKMITVRVGGQVLTDEQIATGDGRSYNYDPDVPGDLVYDFRWPAEGSTDPPVPPDAVTVIIRDEREAQNFVYDETLVAGDVVATVRLACRDERKVR